VFDETAVHGGLDAEFDGRFVGGGVLAEGFQGGVEPGVGLGR
jgi:hypothetical protein